MQTWQGPNLTHQERVLTLAGVMLALLLAALDQTIVSTAGPAIQRDLHIEPGSYAWITTSYLVASTVLAPVYGKLSDILGRKPVLMAGVVLFLAGSVLCAVSGSLVGLVAARIVQGFGSASLFTSAFAVVADLFAPSERGRYNGVLASVFALSSVVGPLLGGAITDKLGWHWVFLINLPIGVVGLAFIALRMPRLGGRAEADRKPLDWAGGLTLSVAVSPLMTALSVGRAGTWTSPLILGLFAVAVVGTLAFVWAERRAADPLLDLGLFRIPTFAWGNLATFLSGAVFLAAIVFLPLYCVSVLGLSAMHAGLTLTPLSFGIVFGNVLSGLVVVKSGRYKPLLLGSLAWLMLSFGWLAWSVSPELSQGGLTLRLVVMGLGLGPSVPLFSLAIQNAVPVHQLGVATSSAGFFRQMGSTVGVAVLGTLFAAALLSDDERQVRPLAASLPAAVREVWQPASVSAEGALLRPLDVAAAEAMVRATVTPAEQARVLKLVRQVAQARKASLSRALAQLYGMAIALALLALLATLKLPEVPLQRRGGPPTPAE